MLRNGRMNSWCALVGALAFIGSSISRADSPEKWPEWERFVERFVQADGRVVDVTFDAKSTSEGQSYGLFFALVANRPDQFETILKWTNANLTDTQLGDRLPGWLWGKKDDGTWSIKDRNSASDADLWIAYSLLEAGRLWNEPRYDALGRKILALIAKHEVVKVGSAGTQLLPAPIGFDLSGNRYRINPSYLPGFMFTYLSKIDPKGPWADLWQSYLTLAPRIFERGVAPDLFIVNTKGVVTQDSERPPSGSYDAIRVYLWAGMSGNESKALLSHLAPYAKLIRADGQPPEKVNPATGTPLKADWSPIGFAGASLPFLKALNDTESLNHQEARVRADTEKARLFRQPTNYYDQALILFGKGWYDGYYRFDEAGRVVPKWTTAK